MIEAHNGNGVWRLALQRDVQPQDIFCQLAERDIEVERFEVAAPSLEDIFVAMVQGTPENQGGTVA